MNRKKRTGRYGCLSITCGVGAFGVAVALTTSSPTLAQLAKGDHDVKTGEASSANVVSKDDVAAVFGAKKESEPVIIVEVSDGMILVKQKLPPAVAAEWKKVGFRFVYHAKEARGRTLFDGHAYTEFRLGAGAPDERELKRLIGSKVRLDVSVGGVEGIRVRGVHLVPKGE